ncbi:MAG: ABC transporter ATP-binding protein/permease, partial [Clostridia bacterium]|nr:ABC transporter ATP-binding protein/permease [Clostridia bacterium]
LIFDDSFSALDFATDKALRKALKESMSDKTIIVVAQRINTILEAEQILVLDEGKIVGKGSHEELLKTCAVYKEIALSQLSERELGISAEERAAEREKLAARAAERLGAKAGSPAPEGGEING